MSPVRSSVCLSHDGPTLNSLYTPTLRPERHNRQRHMQIAYLHVPRCPLWRSGLRVGVYREFKVGPSIVFLEQHLPIGIFTSDICCRMCRLATTKANKRSRTLSQRWPRDATNIIWVPWKLYVSANFQPMIAQESPHDHITILWLFGGEIIFEVFQSMWSGYLHVRDGQTVKYGITAR